MGDDTGNCFNEFQQIVERGKLGMMELVAMHLRKEGVYACRTLSFAGCKVALLRNFSPFLSPQLFSTHYIYLLIHTTNTSSPYFV